MFHSRKRPPRTVAEAIAQDKRFVFTCKSCKAVISKQPNDLFFRPKMELHVLEQISICSECGAANATGNPVQVVLTVED